jgi:DNA invertase Pin-like site-specific DNA recombinase
MTKAYSYLRTSSDDGKEKAGLPVQREACAAFAARAGFEIVTEFPDDGITGKIPMAARPQGRLLIAALLGDGVKHVLCYDGKRIGRTQPAFWSFIGLCRDGGIAVLSADGTDLCESVMGGVNGLLAEMDHKATVSRLAAGKRIAKAKGLHTDGRYAYGDHPNREHDGERAIAVRIRQMSADGLSSYAIAKTLNAEGISTRYGCEFKTQTIQNILRREATNETAKVPNEQTEHS